MAGQVSLRSAMGYSLHVTRAAGHWSNNDGSAISDDEFRLLVERDPELTFELSQYGSCATWFTESDSPRTLLLVEGNIEAKDPDSETIEKLVGVAAVIGARVQGDDGEIYLPQGRIERDRQTIEGGDWDWRRY